MAILQDVEARLKREERQARSKRPIETQIAGGFLIGVIAMVGILLVVGAIVLTPDGTISGPGTTGYENRAIRNLSELVKQGTEVVLPSEEAIGNIRSNLGSGDFALLASPGATSVRTNTTVSYDVRVVRGEGFDAPVTVSIENLPGELSVEAKPQIVPGDEEVTSIQIMVPSTAVVGNYDFVIKAVAAEQEKVADASLSVSNIVLNNSRVIEVKSMELGNWWQATIGWTTDVPANTWIEYSTHDQFVTNGQQYINISANYTSTSDHSITIPYLDPDVVYHYRIKSIDENQNIVYGKDAVFITAALPE